MGRNKIKIKPIEDRKLRQVTYCKRKRGLIKKTMELSLLCKLEVFLAIVDTNNHLAIYNSEGHIANFVDKYLKFPVNPKEAYSNQDYQIIFEEENEKNYKPKHVVVFPEENLEGTTIVQQQQQQQKQQQPQPQVQSAIADTNVSDVVKKIKKKRSKKRKFVKKVQTIGNRFSFKDKYADSTQPIIYIHNKTNTHKTNKHEEEKKDNIKKAHQGNTNANTVKAIDNDNKDQYENKHDNDKDNDNEIENEDDNGNGNYQNGLYNNPQLNSLNGNLNLGNLPETMTLNSISDDDNNDSFSLINPQTRFNQRLPQYPSPYPYQQPQQNQINRRHIINPQYINNFNQTQFKAPTLNMMNNQFRVPGQQETGSGTIQQYNKKILTFKEILHTLSPSTIKDQQEDKSSMDDTPYADTKRNLNQKRLRDESIGTLSPRQTHLRTRFFQPQSLQMRTNNNNPPQSPISSFTTDKKSSMNQLDDSFSLPGFLNKPINSQGNSNSNQNNQLNSNTVEPKSKMPSMKGNFYPWLNGSK